MDYRIGKCSECGAEYQVPASFAHNVARCKVCKGVVHLGSPAGTAKSEMPARKVAPKQGLEEVKVDPNKKRRGTLERLKAQRAEAEQPAAAPRRSAPKPKPAQVQAKATARPAVRTSGAARGGAAAKSGAGRSRRRRGEDDGEERGSRRGGKPDKKKSPLPLLLGIGAIVLLGGGAYYFKDTLLGKEEPVNAQENDEVAKAEDPATGDAPEETGDTGGEDTTLADTDPEADGTSGDETAEGETKKPADGAETPAPKAEKDPDSIDLAAIPDFGPARGCSEEKFEELQELMASFADPDAGAAGNRAGKALQNESRLAMPVILNVMKSLDFSTKEGYRLGDICQKTLERICNGNNFGWKYSVDPNDVYYNRKATKYWCDYWVRSEENIEDWIKLAKLDEKDPEEAARLRAEFGDGAPPVPEIDEDDLDVD